MNPLLLVGLGAAAMYYLDPEQGARRRARAREQLMKMRRTAQGEGGAAGSRAWPFPHEGERAESPSQTPEGAQHLGR